MICGTKAVTTAAAALGASAACDAVLVQADPANTANVKVGDASSQPFTLRPGEIGTLGVRNLATVYGVAVGGSQNINYALQIGEGVPTTFTQSALPNPSPHHVAGTLGGDSTPAVAAAGDYADNDVVSNSATNGAGVAWVFDTMAYANGGKGRIKTALISCSAVAVVASFRLWLFNANPSASELDDNAAFSIHANDQDKLIGWVDFTALVAGANFRTGLDIPYTCAAADDALYGILQITDAETGEAAGMIVCITLGVDRYTAA